MRKTALVIVVVLSALQSHAQELKVPANPPTQDLTASDPVTWAQPRRVYPPKYPYDALDNRISGYVDVDVLVNEMGGTGEIRSITSQPKNADFESEVQKVLKYWLFKVPTVKCRPQATTGNVRIWFDIKDEKGVISVSHRALPVVPAPPVEPPVSEVRPLARIVSKNSAAIRASVTYPRVARRASAEGVAYISLKVEPSSARMLDIEIAYAGSMPGGYESMFGEAAKSAAAEFKFNPVPGDDRPVTVCVPFFFQLK